MTVDAVLTAVSQVLIEHGYENATTTRVAERAGVSIGSLYQYFPNKESLVATLIERHADEIVAIVDRALSAPAVTSIPTGVRAVIEAAFAAHRLDPRLHKILHEQIPRVGRMGKAMDTNRRLVERVEAFLVKHKRELRKDLQPSVAAIVVVTTADAIGHKAILEPSSGFTMKAATAQAIDLLVPYLVGEPA
jgi:AcrR family transcriptional regulator